MMRERMIIAFVFARGGSKGLPGKNIRPLDGVPLVGRAVQCALDTGLVKQVIVSTDDQTIADVAVAHGAVCPALRPARLATDNTPEWEAWRHAITEMAGFTDLENDVFLSVPPTAPLRSPADLTACVNRYLNGNFDIVVTAKPAARHPSFNMVRIADNGEANLVMPPDTALHRRQDAPPVYDMTTVAYVARPSFVLASSNAFEGRVGVQIIEEKHALDIDTELDFQLAEFLLARNKTGTTGKRDPS